MKIPLLILLFLLIIKSASAQQEPRTSINLNGTWEFDQTVNAFPPAKFTRIIPVPGLVHLANNYGYTGDWFTGNIKDLNPSPTLDWFRHAFALSATYINLTDERYVKNSLPHQPGSIFNFNLAGVNNLPNTVNGTVKVRFINSKGQDSEKQTIQVKLDSFVRTDIPVSMILPGEVGGYVLVAEFTPDNGTAVISRRFLKIGAAAEYSFFQLNPF
jgi:hypothetical protein